MGVKCLTFYSCLTRTAGMRSAPVVSARRTAGEPAPPLSLLYEKRIWSFALFLV